MIVPATGVHEREIGTGISGGIGGSIEEPGREVDGIFFHSATRHFGKLKGDIGVIPAHIGERIGIGGISRHA